MLKAVKLAGPTDKSHWIFPGLLLASAYPWNPQGSSAEAKRAPLQKLVRDANVRIFYCLQETTELARFEPLPADAKTPLVPPYRAVAQDMATDLKTTIEFRHFPIPDRGVPATEAALWQAVDALENDLQRLVQQRAQTEGTTAAAVGAICIQCWGGGGRTSLVVGALLSRLLHKSYKQTHALVQELWSARATPVAHGLTRKQQTFLRGAIANASKKEAPQAKRSSLDSFVVPKPKRARAS
jgi:hypothetical protein